MSDINMKARSFYGRDADKVDLTAKAEEMTHTKGKCPVCAKVFKATPPLNPNVTMKEFYGGRIKFFKDVDCDCTAKYRLCIETRYDPKECQNELNVIDMIILKPGIPLMELRKMELEKKQEEINEAAKEEIMKITEETGTLPKLRDRQEIKKQTVLATIVDLDVQVEKLCYHTLAELQLMCKRRKLRFNKKANKTQLAKLLLAHDPSLVSPDIVG